MDLLSERAAKKELALCSRVDPEVPMFVRTDAGRIRQILLNLVGNAIKFTDEGRIDLRVSVERAAGEPPLPGLDDADRESIVFRVKDTGPGISKTDADSLFRPFSQIDATTTREFGGTGLGLAIAKELASRMGGDVWLERTAERGATFAFSIPSIASRAVAVATAPVSLHEDPDVEERSGRVHRILIAEDNSVNQMVLGAMIEELGLEAEMASDGVEAVQRILATSPDLVLMDCQMPKLDGYAATRSLRTDRSGRGA